MSQLATIERPPALNGDAGRMSPQTAEAVLVHGDIAKLSPNQRMEYYVARCEAAGLDYRTQPFLYVTLQGKLTLYATKACAEQLRKIHGVSVTSITTQQVGDVYVVTCHVQDRQGRTDCSTGAVTVKGLQGDALCNALMKAETKAKRRATLSLCGLGMLDETEIETVPDARRVDPERVMPQGGSPQTDSRFREFAQLFVKSANADWAADCEDVGIRPTELINGYQFLAHLHKWALASGFYPDRSEGWTNNHRNRALSSLYAMHGEAVAAEAKAYVARLRAEAEAKWEAPANEAPEEDFGPGADDE